MRKSSCSWSEGDELSFETTEAVEPPLGASNTTGTQHPKTLIRLVTPSRLIPSTSARTLEVKCQIDVQFDAVKVDSVAVVSNARNVEIYVARDSGTFEYACTARGSKVVAEDSGASPDDNTSSQNKSEPERYRACVADRFAAISAIRLRMLSLRGARKDAVFVDSLVFECTPAHLNYDPGLLVGRKDQGRDAAARSLPPSGDPSDRRESAQPPPPHREDDLRLDHLATIGAQLLAGTERRVLAHVDSCCERLAIRLEAAIALQNARLQRIESLLRRPHTDDDSRIAAATASAIAAAASAAASASSPSPSKQGGADDTVTDEKSPPVAPFLRPPESAAGPPGDDAVGDPAP